MRFTIALSTALLAALILFLGVRFWSDSEAEFAFDDNSAFTEEEEEGHGKRPSDYFFVQRAYPYDSIPVASQRAAYQYARTSRRLAEQSESAANDFTWQQSGPTNIPGRINDFAVHPSDLATVYAAATAGGVFKSTDSGVTWTAVFDDQGSLAMGALAIDPDDPDIIYAGTGDPNVGFDTYYGTGVYKSTDAGVSWTHMGLENSYRIARIIVDELRPDTLFVAAGGRHFTNTSLGGNPDRGVYRSTDGGQNWELVLFISDSTGCVDLAYDPPTGRIFAAMWERIRYVDQPTRLGGITSGVWMSDLSGQAGTWTDLSAISGLPGHSPTNGRIGLTLAPGTSTVYAMYSDAQGVFIGLYRSDDAGGTFSRVNDATLISAPLNAGWQGGWYFGQVRVAPSDPDIVFATGLEIWRSIDGGNSWQRRSSFIHVDQHAMWIDPANPSFIYSGCDGGVNVTSSMGDSWTTRVNQPSTQFYAITIDPSNPERIYGGAQDNGTMRTLTGAIDDWDRIWGGDGFYCLVDPTDPDIIYAESQNGALVKSTDGGSSFSGATIGFDFVNERHGWNTPVVMHPLDHLRLYYGSNFLFLTTNGAASWDKISPDLTAGPHPRGSFGTISSIAVSAVDTNVIYVGTDDAQVWVSQTGGGTSPADWTLINAGLPNRWVTRVAADPVHPNIAYVTFSGYWQGESFAHVFRTENFGANWTGISGNLSDFPVNDIIPDPNDSLTLYIGTDVGVFVTRNLGTSWEPLGTGLPVVPVSDLELHAATGKLVAGTHGRSTYATSLVCCDGRRGDVDLAGTPPAEVNSSDLGLLVDYLFSLPGTVELPCIEEADINGSAGPNPVDSSDLGLLVEYLFADPGTVTLLDCP